MATAERELEGSPWTFATIRQTPKAALRKRYSSPLIQVAFVRRSSIPTVASPAESSSSHAWKGFGLQGWSDDRRSSIESSAGCSGVQLEQTGIIHLRFVHPRQVYEEIGSEVLHSMYEGYNACVLAYGHSASGKTYTIMGLQHDPGLTPRLCEGLFDELQEKRSQGNIRVRVVISFLEIYNEKVRDLLGSEETGTTCGNFSLRVREHPKLGPYVQGLSEHSVTDKRKLLQLLTTGNRRRSTAATENNIHSSRSHAVFTIQFKQSDGGNYETEKSSKVHLVDLAGSERARSSQSKARLQEGANINKSLATLGNVISALAESHDSGVSAKERSGSKSWQPFVPYRDSVLTWLLKDTLGGNSNTIMIATISPARSCASETVNTLRYAKRAKKIVNRPIVNEDPKIRTIRELRKEIARLKSLLNFFRSIEEDDWNKKEKREESTERGEEINTNSRPSEVDEEKTESGGLKSSAKNGCKGDVWGGDACEIGDEKKSDVNGSVNDNFSHETQFFSDSLESFPRLLPKSGNSCDAGDDGSRKPETGDNEFEMRVSAVRNLGLSSRAEFGSAENLAEEAVPEMLHRSRPDLIKGISTRGKDDGLPLGSSHSCTDVSNLSQSTSENSLNSSAGSADAHAAENRSPRNPGSRRPGVEVEKRQKGAREHGGGNGVSGRASQRKEKRLEIVEAVTSRLYATKKTPDSKTEALKKEDNDDCGDVDELKLCKRARMKLFDLSRKLAMNRKIKKTVDSNTQTDCATGTVRVKEKCVTTDPSESEEVHKGEDKKPYVVMNQVFIPRASNYVVECGGVVRVEGPEALARQESATQTSGACNYGDASRARRSPRDEDSFSEDSLDLEAESAGPREVSSGGGKRAESENSVPEETVALGGAASVEVCLLRDFEKRFKVKSASRNTTRGEGQTDATFLGPPLPIFLEEKVNSEGQMGFSVAKTPSGASDWRNVENVSSENSFTSTEGTECNSFSETSSEEFVFFEYPRNFLPKGKATSDRELYTITENSEQSDPGDALSPVQRSRAAVKAKEEQGETRKRVENSQLQPRKNEAKEEVKTLDGATKRREKFSPVGDSRKLQSGATKTRISPNEVPDKVLTSFSQAFNSRETAWDDPKVPKCVFSPTGDALSKYPSRSENTNTEYRLSEKFAAGSEAERAEVRHWSGAVEGRAKQPNGTDFQINSQKQYLNLDISSSDRAPPFSVETNLFGKPSRRDQSAEAMSSSADSITFVFMGPAKPETSVLMEIIGRSLGRSSASNETPSGQRKSRSRGVQCDAGLMRSVSVDTAMIALSRIARNQEASPEMQRTNSLGKLNPDEMLGVLEEGKLRNQVGRGCRCELENGHLQEEEKKRVLKYSVGTYTGTDEDSVRAEEEKRKKTVSWFGEKRKEPGTKRREDGDTSEEHEEPDFGLECEDFPEVEVDRTKDLKSRLGVDSDLTERRVRFLKEKSLKVAVTGPVDSEDGLTAFLKEATQLLKNINSRSTKRSPFSEEAVEEFDAETYRKKDETRKGGLKVAKKVEETTGTGKESRQEKKDTGWRWKAPGERNAEQNGSICLTWPRRRAGTGKPPTGTKLRFPRSPLPPRSEFSHPNGGPPNPRSHSPGNRTAFNGQFWNLSNLSDALGDSCLGDVESRPLGCRSSFCNETDVRKDAFHLPRVTSPKRTSDPKPNRDPISDLEIDLKQSCRRLEMATEQDRMREKIQETKKKRFGYAGNREGLRTGSEDAGEKHGAEKKKPREAMKRRRTERCAGSCGCQGSGREPCKHLWSRGCRSSFELDSFGPGSKHCHQLCMFCRKKEAEIYYSAVCLNSECSSGLCRLNYYGFCPCSPVKLNQVVLSPRAYMQRLLALRKRIVSETKRVQLDPEEMQRRRRDPTRRLSPARNFI